jgi:tetratricopeptide (TPR) repeat protein
VKKNILLTLAISLFVASMAFSSCYENNADKFNQSNDNQLFAANFPIPDTAVSHKAKTSSIPGGEIELKPVSPTNPGTTTKGKKTSATPGVKPSGPTVVKPKDIPDPNRPKELFNGIDKAQKGDLQGAIVDFDSCILKNPRNYNAYFYKAKAQIELNEPQKAMANLNLAIQYNPVNPIIFYYRGKLFYDAGEIDKAYDDFDSAVSLNPGLPDPLNFRGVIKAQRGKHAEALEDYNAALKINPIFATAYFNKGTSEAALASYADAIASFSKCIELDSVNVSSYMNRGNCYFMTKEYRAAIADYTKVISIDPSKSDAYFNRGAACQYSGDKNACNDWLKAKSLGNKKADAMLEEYCK